MEPSRIESRAEVSAAYLAEDRSGVLVAISIAMAALTTTILLLRFYAKRFQGGGFFADDAFTVASYIVNLGMCAVGILITMIGGVGRHVEYITASDPSKLVGWAQGLFAFELIYFTSIALPKLAIICLYLRMFNWKGGMRALAWVLFALVSMTSVSLVVAACFQCIPIAFWWDRTIEGGTCFDIQGFFHAQAVPGFVLDLAIMALPIETIWGLKLPRVKRFALLGIFAVASFGIVASIIRAKIFFGTAAFTDETMASVDLIGWSIIETSVYIITNCLPHLRPLISHYTPDFIKRALKSTLASMGTYGDPTGKTLGGQSKMSGLKSFGHSRRSPDTRNATDDEDDTIELTHQRAELGLNSPAGRDASWSDGATTLSSEHGGQSPGWERAADRAHVGASKVECRSGGDSFRDGNGRLGRSGGLGAITVTREVKLTRS